MARTMSIFFKASALLLLTAFFAFSAGAHKVPAGYTYAHIRGFWQDYLNVTDFILLLGLDNLGTGLTPVSGPYGTMIVYDDPFTLTADFNSKLIGSIRGTGVVCSFDGLTTCWAFTIKVKEGRYKGTLTFSSTIATTIPDVAPISGGTGDFLFSQGYALIKPVDVRTTNVTYSVDINVYWPPFASS